MSKKRSSAKSGGGRGTAGGRSPAPRAGGESAGKAANATGGKKARSAATSPTQGRPSVSRRVWSRGVRSLMKGQFGDTPWGEWEGPPAFVSGCHPGWPSLVTSRHPPWPGLVGTRHGDWPEFVEGRHPNWPDFLAGRHPDWPDFTAERHWDWPALVGGGRHRDFPPLTGATVGPPGVVEFRHPDWPSLWVMPSAVWPGLEGGRHRPWPQAAEPAARAAQDAAADPQAAEAAAEAAAQARNLAVLVKVAEWFGDMGYARSLRTQWDETAKKATPAQGAGGGRGAAAVTAAAASGGGIGNGLPPANTELLGLGYLPDRSDPRDHSLERLMTHARKNCPHVQAYGRRKSKGLEGLPMIKDMRGALPPPLHQGAVQNCSAHAVLAMAEHHLKEEVRDGNEWSFSRFFLYKVAREILRVQGDVGCTLRETVKAMSKYGCVSDLLWPARPWNLERMPSILDLEAAGLEQPLAYSRLDKHQGRGHDTLVALLHCLADGFPVAFGFSLFANVDAMTEDWVIPLPGDDEAVLGGHAVLAVGYRIHLEGAQKDTSLEADIPREKLKGEVLIRNSWGPDWGDQGHAWLPFEYITGELSYDFWVQYPAVKERL